MKAILCLLALAGGLLADVNLTGKWTGTFSPVDEQGVAHEGSAFLQLKQSGSEITGTAGPSEDEQHAISKGKIDGNKVTFEISGDGAPMVMVFTLVASEDTLKGDVAASGEGRQMKAKLEVKRAK